MKNAFARTHTLKNWTWRFGENIPKSKVSDIFVREMLFWRVYIEIDLSWMRKQAAKQKNEMMKEKTPMQLKFQWNMLLIGSKKRALSSFVNKLLYQTHIYSMCVEALYLTCKHVLCVFAHKHEKHTTYAHTKPTQLYWKIYFQAIVPMRRENHLFYVFNVSNRHIVCSI